jgi:hypothetical protein
MESQEITYQWLVEESSLARKLHQTFRNEEKNRRLKSSSLGLKAIDRNTTFLHEKARAREQSNNVQEMILENGEWINNFDEICSTSHKLYTLRKLQ